LSLAEKLGDAEAAKEEEGAAVGKEEVEVDGAGAAYSDEGEMVDEAAVAVVGVATGEAAEEVDDLCWCSGIVITSSLLL
jgi:hypothetical protein